MIGFDLDDTLAKVEYDLAGERGLANVYRSAKLLYKPSEPFIVVTARRIPSNADRNATIDWMKENVPNYRGLYFVTGTEDQIIQKKVSYIRSRELTSWTDNNRDILAKIKELTTVPLYWMKQDGTRERF